MSERKAVPATPETIPASNIDIKARAALFFDRRWNHIPNPRAAGIKLNPLAEALMVVAKRCHPFPLQANRCERNQSSAQNKRPKIGKPISTHPRSQCPTGCR